MRWFTDDWARGRMSDEQSERVVENYRAHLRQIAARATGTVEALARMDDPALDLSDGLIDSVHIDTTAALITLRLVQGDVENGYRTLELRATDATLCAPSPQELADAMAHPQCEIWYWELEQHCRDSRFELHFLLWPSGEVALEFDSLHAFAEPRADRHSPAPARVVSLDGTVVVPAPVGDRSL